MNNKKIDDYVSISPTAILTAYPRTFTDIPYEKEIYDYIKKNLKENIVLNEKIAPEIEARYKLTNKLLNATNIKQVVELAAGYSSRGLIYSKQGYNYIELDLEKVSENKRKIIQEIDKINSNLHIINCNVLNKLEFNKCEQFLNINNEVAVINEGLLRYLTFEEKKQVALNVYELLSKYGGVWITCDATPKKFIQTQDKAIPNFNESLNATTSRNSLSDRFDNLDHVKNFFGEIGFEIVEVHKFNEMIDELVSPSKIDIDKEKMVELLSEAIVVVMKIKKEVK